MKEGCGVEMTRKLLNKIEEEGFEILIPYNNGGMALPRVQEVLAVFNRIR